MSSFKHQSVMDFNILCVKLGLGTILEIRLLPYNSEQENYWNVKMSLYGF